MNVEVRELLRNYGADSFTYSFEELRALMAEIEAEAPAEVRDSLLLCGSYERGSYDESDTCYVIVMRDETQAEAATRAAAEAARTEEYNARRRAENEARDRAEYQRLKAKFG